MLAATIAPVAKADMFEPFSTSNLNPFVALYGLPGTRSARITSDGEFSWHLQTEFSNNFTTSANASEAITLDGESHRATVSLRYGINDNWELGLDIPTVRHSGGSLDGFIENWHDTFGLPNGGREDVRQDRLIYQYQKDGTNLVNFRRSASGIGDIRLNLARKVKQTESKIWTLRGGVKFSTGDASDLTGSDSTDIYTSLHLTDTALFEHPNLFFHGNIGLMILGDGEILSQQLEDYVVFGSSTIAWHGWERVTLKVQLDFHTAFYDSELKELGDFSAQLILGGSLRLTESTLLDISVGEDIITDTSPDVVLQFGLRKTL
jgi:hypothetical protein